MATITLKVFAFGKVTEVEMDGVTSIPYAAKRCAQAVGMDDDQPWRLGWQGHLISEDHIAADYDGALVTPLLLER